MRSRRSRLRRVLLLSALPIFATGALGTPIDTNAPYYLASQLGITVDPIFQGGTLRMDEADKTYTQDFTLGPNPGNTVDIDGDNATIVGRFSGAGGLTISNSTPGGVLYLTGNNTYTGGTTVASGLLSIGNGGATGSIVGDVVFLSPASLTFNRSDTSTYAGNITGPGYVNVTGPGTLILTGTITSAVPVLCYDRIGCFPGYDKDIEGNLQVGNGGASGSITGRIRIGPNGTLAINRSDTYVFAANAGGTGKFVQMGSGTTIITGSYYSPLGVAIISAGTLQIGDGGTTGVINSDIHNNTTLVFNRSDRFEYAGAVSGPGSLQQIGSGTLVLTGDSTHTGGTTIAAGTLQIGNGGYGGSVVGPIHNNATLIFKPADMTFNGTIDGVGCVQLIGNVQAGSSGTLILNGVNTYSGTTTVSAGTLVVNGSIASSASTLVSQGAQLRGLGVVGNTIIGGSGVLAPGNWLNSLTTIGTINVSGNLTLGPASVLAEELSSSAADKAVVSGATSLSGILYLLPREGSLEGTYVSGTRFQIIDSTGTISGAFSQIIVGRSFGTAIAPYVSYDAHGAYLALLSTSLWNANPPGNDWSEGGDWAAGGVPTSNDIAGFGATSKPSIDIKQAVSIASLQFEADAPSYTFNITGGAGGPASLSVTNIGIIEKTSHAPRIVVGGVSVENSGTLAFTNAATAGDATIIVNAFGNVRFTGNSSAQDASFVVNSGGVVDFSGTIGPNTDWNVFVRSLTGTGSVMLGRNALTLTAAANSSTEVGVVIADGGASGGTGASLKKAGPGSIILTANNAYTGGTTISAGALQIGNGLATGWIVGDVADNGTLIFDRSDTINFGGAITGTGALQQTGSGTLVLSGTNFYSGDTTVANGSLKSGANGSFSPNSVIRMADSASVALDLAGHAETIAGLEGGGAAGGNVELGDGTLTIDDTKAFQSYGGVISGTGGLNLAGGSLIVSGANTYTGGTTIGKHGGLAIGVGGTAGSIVGDVINDGGISFNRADAYTFAGSISGTGGVAKFRNATLIFTGTNTYAGITEVGDGTLQIGNGGTAGSIVSDVELLNASLVFDRSDTYTFAGIISNTGTVRQIGSGTLILSGNSSYSGSITANSGSTLQFGNGGTAGSITGNVSNDGTLVFDRSDTYTYGGVISGSGAVRQIGTGTLILTGANTYSGGTTIDSGSTLQLGDYGSGGSIVGDVRDDGVLAFAHSTFYTYDGVISGSGALQLRGGTLRLTGANTYTGGTIVAATTTDGGATYHGSALGIDGGGNTGSIVGDVVLKGVLYNNVVYPATLTFSNRGTYTFAGNISSEGDHFANYVAVSNVTTLILTGNNTYTGTTYVQGTLQVGSANALSPNSVINMVEMAGITHPVLDLAGYSATIGGLGGGGTVHLGSGALTVNGGLQGFGGVISGTGSLTIGSGTQILYGANTYTGNTTIHSGATLQFSDGGTSGSIVGDVMDNGVLAFNRSDTITFAGNISGSGSLLQLGNGTLVFRGANTYSGPTSVSHGTLQAGTVNTFSPNSAVVMDNVVNATLDLADYNETIGGLSGGGAEGGNVLLGVGTLTSNNGGTYAGIISGTGGFTLAGGMLILNGVNTYTGLTTITAGTLEVGDAAHPTAQIAGPVTVNAGATLSGHGHILGPVTNNGTVSPGGSIGTLTVASFTQSASGTLQLDVTPTEASQLVVTGAAVLDGTLHLSMAPGVYTGQLYPLLTATSVAGRFASVVYSGPANVIGGLTTSSSGVSVGVQSPTAGQIYSDLAYSVFGRAHKLNAMVLEHPVECPTGCPSFSFWGRGFAGTGSIDARDSDAASSASRWAGIVGGFDYRLSDRASLGVALSYSQTASSVSGGWGKSLANSWSIALTGSRSLFGGRLDTDAYYWFDEASVHRGSSGVLAASPDNQVYGAAVQYGYPLLDGRLEPMVRFDYARSRNVSTRESGPNAFAVNVDAPAAGSLLGEIGLRYRDSFTFEGLRLTELAPLV